MRAGKCANVLYGKNHRWFWGGKTINGGMNLAYMAGRMGHLICGRQPENKQQFWSLIRHPETANTPQ